MNSLIQMLTELDRVNIFIHSNEECSNTDDWSNTSYQIEDVDKSFWNTLMEPTLGNLNIAVPEPNPLIPHNFEMRELKAEYCHKPVKLFEDAWY